MVSLDYFIACKTQHQESNPSLVTPQFKLFGTQHLNKRKRKLISQNLLHCSSFFYFVKRRMRSEKCVTLRVNIVWCSGLIPCFLSRSIYSFFLFFFYQRIPFFYLVLFSGKRKVYTCNEAIFFLVVIIYEKPFVLVKGYILDSLLQNELQMEYYWYYTFFLFYKVASFNIVQRIFLLLTPWWEKTYCACVNSLWFFSFVSLIFFLYSH